MVSTKSILREKLQKNVHRNEKKYLTLVQQKCHFSFEWG